MNISKDGTFLSIGTKSILIESITAIEYDKYYVYLSIAQSEEGQNDDTSGIKIDIKTVLGFESSLELRNFIVNLISGVEAPWYGIEFDTATPDPACTRIYSEGGINQHYGLPVQSAMRRCVIDNESGKLKYYLHPTNSTLKEDGVTPAVLDGTDGYVMVEIPEHYRLCEEVETLVRVKISLSKIDGGVLVPKMYISAFEPTLDRTDPLVYKLASVVNESPAFRGGDNNPDWDLEPRTLLCRPVGGLTLDLYRRYASNNNAGNPSWNAYLYEAHVAVYWLYVIEYANRNSQAEFKGGLTFAGFRQGGLGAGATTMTAGWDYANYQAFIPCGITNVLGNESGEVPYEIPVEFVGAPETIMCCSYRGIEHPFGHLAKWADGFHATQVIDGEDTKCGIYVCGDPSRFTDSSNRYYELRGMVAQSDGYISKQLLGSHADIIGAEFAGEPETYVCDSGSNYGADNAANIVLLAGGAYDGSHAGLGYAYAVYDPSYAYTYIGSRLCFKTVGATAPRRAILTSEPT